MLFHHDMVYVFSFLAICRASEPCTSFPESEKPKAAPAPTKALNPCLTKQPFCRPHLPTFLPSIQGMGTARIWALSASTKSLNVQGCPFPSTHSATPQRLHPGPSGLTAHKAPLSAGHKATSGLRFALQMPPLKVCDTGQGQGRGVSQCSVPAL